MGNPLLAVAAVALGLTPQEGERLEILMSRESLVAPISVQMHTLTLYVDAIKSERPTPTPPKQENTP